MPINGLNSEGSFFHLCYLSCASAINITENLSEIAETYFSLSNSVMLHVQAMSLASMMLFKSYKHDNSIALMSNYYLGNS